MYHFALVTSPWEILIIKHSMSPLSRIETLKNSFFTQIYRPWNELPLNIRDSNTELVYREKLFHYFYDKFSANFLS